MSGPTGAMADMLKVEGWTLLRKVFSEKGVIEEFSVEAVRLQLGISNNRAEGFGGHLGSEGLSYITSKHPKNTCKMNY